MKTVDDNGNVVDRYMPVQQNINSIRGGRSQRSTKGVSLFAIEELNKYTK